MDSNKKIRAKVRELFQENLGTGSDTFIDTIKHIDIYHLNTGPDETLFNATGRINFLLELETKNWGIAGLHFEIENLVVDKTINNENNDEKRIETTVYIHNKQAIEGYSVSIEKLHGQGIVSVHSIEIDEKAKSISITFKTF